jgi:hypothetical protein
MTAMTKLAAEQIKPTVVSICICLQRLPTAWVQGDKYLGKKESEEKKLVFPHRELEFVERGHVSRRRTDATETERATRR